MSVVYSASRVSLQSLESWSNKVDNYRELPDDADVGRHALATDTQIHISAVWRPFESKFAALQKWSEQTS